MCFGVNNVLPCFAVEYNAAVMGCFELEFLLLGIQRYCLVGRFFLSPSDERAIDAQK